MKITLNKLTLKDFQGGTFTLDTNGGNVSVYAANAIGKTRLISAFTWLLFNKDSLGRSDFEIKNLDAQGEAEHGLEHSVEGEFKMIIPTKAEGVQGTYSITLRKIYKEEWTKKRGSTQSTFTGHTNLYFVNGVPVQKKDFTEHVKEIVGDEEIFRLLTSPTVFPALPEIATLKNPKMNQRSILMEMSGDISDDEVMATDKKLAGLHEIIGDHTLDEHRKIITARKTTINKEIEKIPVRIDEVNRALPDVSGLDRKAIIKDIGARETEINNKKLELQGVDTGGRIADISKKLNIARADISKMENDFRSNKMTAAWKIDDQIKDIERNHQRIQTRIDDINEELNLKNRYLGSIEGEIVNLRNDWGEANSLKFQDEVTDTCAACGQSLPSNEVQAAKDKALAEFNRTKAEKLAYIDRHGKAIAEEKEQYRAKIEALQKELAEIEEVAVVSDLLVLTAERDELEKSANDYTFLPEHDSLSTHIFELEVGLQAEKDGKAGDLDNIKDTIDGMTINLNDLKAYADMFTRREAGINRIEELKTEEKTLAAEYEKLESEIYLTECFIKAKVNLLTDKINNLFETVQFKLFDIQVNGGISECCEITVNGVPYNGGLNNAGRINAGLDVCRTLARHMNLQAPIFVDNAEAVCDLINMDTQVIRLVVSKEDAVMRVENN